MILDLSDDAKEYGHEALRAFEAAGGDQLVQQAEAKPETRESLIGPALTQLGAWDLDPRSDTDGLEAAAALCRSAGYWALPYPVPERLAKPTNLDVEGLLVARHVREAAADLGEDLVTRAHCRRHHSRNVSGATGFRSRVCVHARMPGRRVSDPARTNGPEPARASRWARS